MREGDLNNEKYEEVKFKVVLVGASGSGKTSFVQKHITGKFSKEHRPTVGVEVHPLTFYARTNIITDDENVGLKKKITFNVWDTAGEAKLEGLGSAYQVGTNALMVFYDPSKPKDIVEAFRHLFILLDDSIAREALCPIIVIATKTHPGRHQYDGEQEMDRALSEFRRNTAKDVYHLSLSKRSPECDTGSVEYARPFLLLSQLLTKTTSLEFA